MLLAIVYAVSVATCVCRAAAPAPTAAATHSCCHAKDHHDAPTSQEKSPAHCPHCEGRTLAVAEKQTAQHDVSDPAIDIPACFIPEFASPSTARNPIPTQSYISPPQTLLQLRCALTT
jgi:hypothetical protein